MFLIMLTYKQSIEVVEQYLKEHRAFLGEGYTKNWFIVSGPKIPRTGGVIISNLKDKNQLELILKQDPFYVNGVADFEIIEFTPVKHHPNFASFV